MAWSTSSPTLPSGSSWSSWVETGQVKTNYLVFKIKSRIARGSNNTVYVAVQLIANRFDYNTEWPTLSARAEVSINNGSYVESSSYTGGPFKYATDTVFKTVYYTGTANAGVSVKVRGYTPQQYTGVKSYSAPAYVTKHTITYYGNGDTASSSTTQSKLYGSTATIYGCSWTKTGYHFVHWNTKADGTGTAYNAGAAYSTNANLTLYAIWAINTYEVTYNANGGSGTTAAQTKTYGVALALQENGFTYSGHVFNHWNTKADDSGTRYAAGATYTGNAALTLYAIWDGTWPIIYDGNGATGGSTESQTKVEEQDLTISANGFLRDKHTFVEWNTAPDGTGVSYAPGDTYQTDAALTLYAIWLKNNIPVFFNDDGTVRQVERAFYNDNGVIRECSLYYNDDGTIRPIT